MFFMQSIVVFGNRKEPVFPLLTKILDANDWLSVQVHPDDAYGLEHEGELGKTECWYIIAAEPGAVIYGLCKSKKNCVSKLKVRIGKIFDQVPVKAGDFLCAKCSMHAIGAGILVVTTVK